MNYNICISCGEKTTEPTTLCFECYMYAIKVMTTVLRRKTETGDYLEESPPTAPSHE